MIKTNVRQSRRHFYLTSATFTGFQIKYKLCYFAFCINRSNSKNRKEEKKAAVIKIAIS